MSYNLQSNVLSVSGVNASQLDTALAGTGLAGLGGAFLAIEQTNGINALFAAAHAALESAWGTSELATAKHNLFGINATDSDPNGAYAYPSFAACLSFYGQFLKANYLTPGGFAYNGTTIHDIFILYATAHDAEGSTVAAIMNELQAKVPAVVEASEVTVTPIVNVVTPISQTVPVLAMAVNCREWDPKTSPNGPNTNNELCPVRAEAYKGTIHVTGYVKGEAITWGGHTDTTWLRTEAGHYFNQVFTQ